MDLQKDLQDLELELTDVDANKDKLRMQMLRLKLQDPLSTCDLKELAPVYIKQVLNDHVCIQCLTPPLLSLLSRTIADNEKNNVSKGEIQDLLSQLGQTSL